MWKGGRRRASDIVMTVVFEEDVLMLICEYATQSEKSLGVDELKCAWDMHSTDDFVMCLGYINGHVGRHIDGFDGVHGGYGVGQRNLERRMLLEFCLKKESCVKYMP